MDFDYEAQRRYCEQLGLIHPGDSRSAIWENSRCRQVCGLLDDMRKQADKMASAKGWMLNAVADDDRRLTESDEIHSVTSIGNTARHAIDYDCAAAAYSALQEQLQRLVIRIRTDAGYDVNAFDRLESHPVLSPADAAMVRELDALRGHYRSYASRTDAAKRRHLVDDHGYKPAEARRFTDLELIHDDAHQARLVELLTAMARIQREHPGITVPA